MFALLRNKSTQHTHFSDDIIREYRYEPISPLDIEDYSKIEWSGNEFNRLYQRDGKLVKFCYWLGHYPFVGVAIEVIGTVQKC